MKYNGLKLIEMTPEKWDGNRKFMLVWRFNNDTMPQQREVVEWYKNEHGFVIWRDVYNDYWPHCAEIPTEEKEDAMKLLIDNENEILELREENQELKTKVNELKNSSSYQTYCGLRNVIAKLEDKIANLKKENKETEEKNNKEDQIAWLNNQITNLQYELSQPCIDCEYKAKQLAMYKSFLELIYETK